MDKMEPDEPAETALSISVEFSGGLENLFANNRNHKLTIHPRDAEGQKASIMTLVDFLCRHTMKSQRQEMFVIEGVIRPGILVLINDADWELEGGPSYVLQDGDSILFVSTLHGG